MKARLVLFVALIGLLETLAVAAASGYSSLRDVDFNNFSYKNQDLMYRVVDGNYTGSSSKNPHQAPEGASESLEVDAVIYGHLTQSDSENAVVKTQYNGGGSGLFDTLHIFKLEDGRPVQIATLEAGDRAHGGIKDFYIENGSLFIVNYDSDRNMCCACYDFEVIREFQWKDGELSEVWASEARPVAEEDDPNLNSEDPFEDEEDLPEILVKVQKIMALNY